MAGGQVGHGSLGAREVDQHVGAAQGAVQVGADGHPRGTAQQGTGVLAEGGAVCHVQGAVQLQITTGQHRLDQHAPHASGAAGDDGLHRGSSGG
jgi:hypothetical protein